MVKTLLVVDDSMFIYEELRRIAQNMGFDTVHWAKSGEQALEMYEACSPDVVTMDIVMSGMDGVEAAELMRERWPDARIVMVSSLAYGETQREAAEAGVIDFIYKPFEPQAVVSALQKALSR